MTYDQTPWLRFYPQDVPSEIEIPEMTLPEAFDEAVSRWKDRTAIIFYGTKISYRQLKDQVDRFATALYDLGVRKEDRIALLMPNSPQYIISFYGALKIGAIVTPVSPVYVSSEVKHQLEDSGAKTIVCLDLLLDTVEKTQVQLQNVILTNIGAYLPRMKRFSTKNILRGVYRNTELTPDSIAQRGGTHKFEELIKKYPPKPPKIDIKPEDIAALPYSGGTTGVPKGIMLSHRNYIADVNLNRAFFLEWMKDGKEVIAAYQPFYHAGGTLFAVVGGIIRGFTLVIFTTPDFDEIVQAVVNLGVTSFSGAPSAYEFLKDYEKTDRVNWKSIFTITGADSLLESTAERWKERTGNILVDTYGMTESTCLTHGTLPHRPKKGTVGVPMPNTIAAILEPDGDKLLPPGEIGEIIVKGPQLMKGYWNKPEETQAAFVEIAGERWLKTGDLGTMDEEGYFSFYDRKRDMIKYKGYSVFAREVEDVLASHPQIKEVGVVGVPDPKVGEQIKAFVVLQREARGKLSEEDITKYCEDKLAHYKIPKVIQFVGEVPKTDVGKISRRELRLEY
jgi:long-chain acyl-CoA synthetase